MHTYMIQYQIRTLAILTKNFRLDGFTFSHWDFNHSKGWFGDAWLVKGKIEAETWLEAINSFAAKLEPISNVISLVSQCHVNIKNEPFLLFRVDENPNKICVLRYSEETRESHLHFSEDQIFSLKRARKLSVPQAFFEYVNESTNASTYHSRFALLIMALESLGGTIDKIRKCDKCGHENKFQSTDYEKLKAVIGDDLFAKIYKFRDGFRQNMFHGKSMKLTENLHFHLYKAIISFFNRNHGLKISETVVSPQRNFYNIKKAGFIWFRLKNKSDFDLKALMGKVKNEEDLDTVGIVKNY